MIKTILREKPLKIDFEHEFLRKPINNREKSVVRYSTKCIIEFGEDKKSAIASVDKNDNPNKRIGRRLSLKKALANFDFSKSERKEIWNLYNLQTVKLSKQTKLQQAFSNAVERGLKASYYINGDGEEFVNIKFLTNYFNENTSYL